jgi:hypothetical protein
VLVSSPAPPLRDPDLILLASLRSTLQPGGGDAWVPVCLPHHDPDHFVSALLALLSPRLCLVLVCTEREAFGPALQYKQDLLTMLEGPGLPRGILFLIYVVRIVVYDCLFKFRCLW